MREPRSYHGLYRALAFGLSVGLIGLWIAFSYGIFTRADRMPAPAAIMLPIFYCSVALGAARAALKDEPIVLIIAGGVSLMPMGLLLLLIPGPSRWIAAFDVALIALGVLILRSHPGRDADAADAAEALEPAEAADVVEA